MTRLYILLVYIVLLLSAGLTYVVADIVYIIVDMVVRLYLVTPSDIAMQIAVAPAVFCAIVALFGLPMFAILDVVGRFIEVNEGKYYILCGVSVALFWVQPYERHWVLADPRPEGGRDVTFMDLLNMFVPTQWDGFSLLWVACHFLPAGIVGGMVYGWCVARIGHRP